MFFLIVFIIFAFLCLCGGPIIWFFNRRDQKRRREMLSTWKKKQAEYDRLQRLLSSSE